MRDAEMPDKVSRVGTVEKCPKCDRDLPVFDLMAGGTTICRLPAIPECRIPAKVWCSKCGWAS